jgi:hypothetical protein
MFPVLACIWQAWQCVPSVPFVCGQCCGSEKIFFGFGSLSFFSDSDTDSDSTEVVKEISSYRVPLMIRSESEVFSDSDSPKSFGFFRIRIHNTGCRRWADTGTAVTLVELACIWRAWLCVPSVPPGCGRWVDTGTAGYTRRSGTQRPRVIYLGTKYSFKIFVEQILIWVPASWALKRYNKKMLKNSAVVDPDGSGPFWLDLDI